jgi:hypothetical protein
MSFHKSCFEQKSEIKYLWQQYRAYENEWHTIGEYDDYPKALIDYTNNSKGWYEDVKHEQKLYRIVEKKCTFKVKVEDKESMKRYQKHLRTLRKQGLID